MSTGNQSSNRGSRGEQASVETPAWRGDILFHHHFQSPRIPQGIIFAICHWMEKNQSRPHENSTAPLPLKHGCSTGQRHDALHDCHRIHRVMLLIVGGARAGAHRRNQSYCAATLGRVRQRGRPRLRGGGRCRGDAGLTASPISLPVECKTSIQHKQHASNTRQSERICFWNRGVGRK